MIFTPKVNEALIFTFQRRFVRLQKTIFPFVLLGGRVETLDLSPKEIPVELTNGEAIVCKDEARMNIGMKFKVEIQADSTIIEEICMATAAQNGGRYDYVEMLFWPKLVEAIHISSLHFTSDELLASTQKFENLVRQLIGQNLNGYKLSQTHVLSIEKIN